MGTQGIKTDKKLLIQAIYDANGIVRKAARLLDVYTDVIYHWRDKDEDVAKALKEAKAKNLRQREDWIDQIKLDMYEQLHTKMSSGDITAIIFALKTFGGHADGSGITINVIKKDPTIE